MCILFRVALPLFLPLAIMAVAVFSIPAGYPFCQKYIVLGIILSAVKG
jgi:hypothetical protein